MNNRMFDSMSAFLGRNEDTWSSFDRTKFHTAKFALSKMSASMKRKLYFSIPAPYEMIGVHAGETESTHHKILPYCWDQYCVPLEGQSDVLICGITFVSPYNVNSIMNPLLVSVMTTGYFFNFYRNMPVVKKNGVMIVTHPCYDEFDPVFHPSYSEFFNRILTETRDSFVIQQKYEEEFARNPRIHPDVPQGQRLPWRPPLLHVVLGRKRPGPPGQSDRRRRRQQTRPVYPRLGYRRVDGSSTRDGPVARRETAKHQPDAFPPDPDGRRRRRPADDRGFRHGGRRNDGTMKHLTSWRFDPVAGEYREIDRKAAPGGSGDISAIDQFHSKTILFLGASGFVGKVLLALILESFPELKHLVVQVRRKKHLSGEQRFYSEVLQSPSLRATVDLIGVDSIRKKVTIVEGDLSLPMCGIRAEQLAQLTDAVDVIINTAGLVEFEPPLDESLITNVYGIRNLIELVQLLDVKLVHISTCYVAGKRDGRMPEDEEIVGYYPNRKDANDTRFRRG